MAATIDTTSEVIPRLVWASSGDLEAPTHRHDKVLPMLRWDSGVDVRKNTIRYVIDYGARGRRLSEEQKRQIKEELERQIKAAFHDKKEPLPIVCFPSGQQFDSRMVDFYCSQKGEVDVLKFDCAAGQFTFLGKRGLGFNRFIGNIIERNEQLLRIKDLPDEHLKAFVEDREALLRDAVGRDARIKDVWALDKADGSFSEQVDVLIALPDEEDAVTAAHDWPGWLAWNGRLLELAYRNRFAYCCHCKESGSNERHLRKHCEVAPPMDVDEEEEFEDDDGDFIYDERDHWIWTQGKLGWRPPGWRPRR